MKDCTHIVVMILMLRVSMPLSAGWSSSWLWPVASCLVRLLPVNTVAAPHGVLLSTPVFLPAVQESPGAKGSLPLELYIFGVLGFVAYKRYKNVARPELKKSQVPVEGPSFLPSWFGKKVAHAMIRVIASESLSRKKKKMRFAPIQDDFIDEKIIANILTIYGFQDRFVQDNIVPLIGNCCGSSKKRVLKRELGYSKDRFLYSSNLDGLQFS